MCDVPDVYTNSVHISASLYDITFSFRLQDPEESSAEAKELLRVRMSPQQAAAVHLVLGRNLEVYGEQFQKVFLPDDLVTRLRGHEEAGATDDED